ncbi:transcription initiation factor IIB [Blyttiomyces sp. JEL0837]|nr:transcription initiation factor IIB [Blyttiomyces sp. JEL0837]
MAFVSGQVHGPHLPTPDLNFKLICKHCKNPHPNIIEEFSQGDMICGDCGLVLGTRIIDTRSEWRTFANSEDAGDDPSRVGAAGDALLGGANHLESTSISRHDGGSGRGRDIARIHNKIADHKGEKILLANFRQIATMSERIGLSKVVVDSAKQLFKKVEDEKLLRGKSTDSQMAACVFVACREHNVTRTFKEICALTNVSKKEIGRCYKILQNHLESPKQQVSWDSFIARFSSELELEPSVQNAGLQVAKKVAELGVLAGKSTISLVAASLYFVTSLSNSPKPAHEVAKVAGCTEATLKNAYKSMYPVRAQLIEGVKVAKGVDELPPA